MRVKSATGEARGAQARGRTGSVMSGLGALVTLTLGPVTNYASAAVPQWAAHAWVIWPVFGALALTSVSLLLWERRLSVSETLSARLTPVGHLAGALHGSLRPLHVEQVRGRERELAVLTRLLRRPTGQFAVLCAAGGWARPPWPRSSLLRPR